jgi:hypothetical protein
MTIKLEIVYFTKFIDLWGYPMSTLYKMIPLLLLLVSAQSPRLYQIKKQLSNEPEILSYRLQRKAGCLSA